MCLCGITFRWAVQCAWNDWNHRRLDWRREPWGLGDWSPWNLKWWRHTLCQCKNSTDMNACREHARWNWKTDVICCSTKIPKITLAPTSLATFYPAIGPNLKKRQHFAWADILGRWWFRPPLSPERISACTHESWRLRNVHFIIKEFEIKSKTEENAKFAPLRCTNICQA